MKLRAVAMAAMLAATIGMIGCGSKKEEATEFKFITAMSDSARTEVIDHVLDQLKEKYPDVTFINDSGEDYNNKAKLGFSSGSGYELVYTDDLGLSALREGGYLLELSEDAKERGWVDRQQEGATDFYNQRTPGEMYTVGTNYAPVVVYYNKDIFEELNLSIPTTLEEYENVLKAATENGYIGAENCKDNINGWYIQSLVQNLAPFEDVLDWYYLEESKDSMKGAFVEAAETVKKWSDAGYFRKDYEGIEYGDVPMLFAQGQTATSLDGNWFLPDYENSGINVGVFAFPSVSDSSQANYIINPVDAAFAIGKHVDEKQHAIAVDFIDLMLSEEVADIWLERGSLPSLDCDYSDAPASELTKELLDAIKDCRSGFYLDNVKPGFLEVFIKEMQLYLLGDQQAEAMWENIDKFWHED